MSYKRSVIIRIFSAVVSVFIAGASPLEEVVARHTATVESLQCISCRVRVGYDYVDPPEQKQFTGEYARFGDRVKCVTKAQDTTDEYVSTAGVAHVFMKRNQRGRQLYSAATLPSARTSISACDAWCGGLLHLSLPNTIDFIPLGSLVGKAKTATLAPKDEIVSGTRCAKLSLTFDCDPKVCKGNWAVDIFLSRDHGLLVKKCVYDCTLANGRRQIRESEVTEFVPTSTRVWFPKTIRYATQVEGQLTMKMDVGFDAVKTPNSLPAEVFSLKFHNPTPMSDHFRRTRYEVDESGRRLSAEKPVTVVRPSSDSAGGDKELPTDTVREPRRITYWVILAVSLSVLAGVGFYAWRKRRARAGATD